MEIRYDFRWRDGRRRTFAVRLDPTTLEMPAPAHTPPPAWARLAHEQCPNCPLEEGRHPHCPIAVRIAGLVEAFGDAVSHEEVDVTVTVPARAYRAETSLQKALGSIVGIYMVTAGCPVMDRLRPMVATHLPFATPEETTYRYLSMYLLAQWFRSQAGLEPDWALAGLETLLEEVMKVNVAFGRRLRSACRADANLNALVILANFGVFTSMELESGLEHWRRLFLGRAGDF